MFLYYHKNDHGQETVWANEMNFLLKHAPQLADIQTRVLKLCYNPPVQGSPYKYPVTHLK